MKPEIEIYGRRTLRFNVDSLSVPQSEFMHDMCTLHMANPGDVDVELLKGQPFRLTWGNGIASQAMYGYVDTTSSLTGDNPTGLALIGLGASSVMRSGHARSWKRSTPFRIARSIVHPYRLSLVSDKYVATVDSFMQSEESDWAALTRLATLAGMSLVATNNAVRLVDVSKAIGRAKFRPVPHFVEPDTFVQLETPSPVGFDTYEFTGIDRLGSSFTLSGGQPGGVKRHSSQNFASLEDARLAAVRQAARQRQYVRAMAEFTGQLNVKCGDVCVVEGQHWYVAQCTHEVQHAAGKHRVSLELHRAISGRPATADVATPPAPVLQQGKWVSARQYEVEL